MINAKIITINTDVSAETQQRLNDLNIIVIYKPFNQSEIKKVLMEKYKINTR
jgi:hypothetical protein